MLIDTCTSFCTSMKDAAEKKNFDLSYFSSIAEMGSVGAFTGYDVAIIEDLCGDMNGLEIGKYLDSFISGMPMIMISDTADPIELIKDSWPFSIRCFVHKDQGVDKILETAIDTF